MTSNELSEKFDKTFWEYLVIKNAMKEGKVYDIDRFWDGKTLFNCPLAPSEESTLTDGITSIRIPIG